MKNVKNYFTIVFLSKIIITNFLKQQLILSMIFNKHLLRNTKGVLLLHVVEDPLFRAGPW